MYSCSSYWKLSNMFYEKAETRTIINLITHIENTKQKDGQRQIPGHTKSGISCLGGVRIPCRPVTLFLDQVNELIRS
jgi:hypothetical protein